MSQSLITIGVQETFQLLRYDEGQFYRGHYDYIPEQADMPCGARVSTFFLYLNDVEEGGETYFPLIHLKVKPKLGRAVLWYAQRVWRYRM